MIEFAPPIDLSNAEAQAVVQGLHAIARVDGMHSSEAVIIGDFYRDVVGDEVAEATLAGLERGAVIDPETLASVLARRDVGRVFIKTAWLMAHADGEVSDGERAAIARYGAALGIPDAGIRDLEAQVEDYLRRQLGHLRLDAVREVARKVG